MPEMSPHIEDNLAKYNNLRQYLIYNVLLAPAIRRECLSNFKTFFQKITMHSHVNMYIPPRLGH